MEEEEVIEENGNSFPAIYTRNTTNSSDHIDQVLEKLEFLRLHGFQQTSPSAYLDKCVFSDSYRFSRHETVIANLAENTRSNDKTVVFVHDLADVTLSSKDHFMELIQLVPEIRWNLLNGLIDRVLSNINCDEIYDTDNFDDPVLTSKFESLKKIYNTFSIGFDRKKSIFCEEIFELAGIDEEEEKQKIRQIVVEHQKVFNQRWKSVEKCLKWVQKISKKTTEKKYENVILCDEAIDKAVVQLLFSGLSSTVPIGNIYSKYAGEPVFERIQHRFDRNCVMIHVNSDPLNNDDLYGDVPEIQRPCWWISSNESFKQLYKAQRDYLSK